MRRLSVAVGLLLLVCAHVTMAQDDGQWRASLFEGATASGHNDYPKAEQAFLRAVHQAESFGPKDARLGTSLNDLGLLYRAEHKYAESEAAYRRALPIMEGAYGLHSIDVANVGFNLASVLADGGHNADVVPVADRVLEVYEKLLGDSSLKTATILCIKGDALRLMKRYSEAESPLRRCADIREKDNGVTSPEFADALLSLARVMVAEGRGTAAETRYQMVDKIREKTVGITSPLLAESMEEHASLLKSLGRDREADNLQTMIAAIRKNQKK
jgi:tetratricopeptide (TPR) repeat protein